MTKRSSGPGLAKIRKVQVVSRRTLEVLALREGWWSSVIERADIVSEGAVVREAERAVYYGSTSLRCPIETDHLSSMPVATPEQLARVIVADPHARLRLLRLAHREAASRAGAQLDVLSADMIARVVREDDLSLLSVDIDVSAPLLLARDAIGSR